MKDFIKQSLLLGGIYFFVSYLLGYCTGVYAETLELIIITALLLTVIALAFKKSFSPLAAFWNRFPKISMYLSALGVAKYFSIIFGGIPGAIDGFLLMQAEHNNEAYTSPMADYLPVFISVYWVVFWVSLLTATYLCFFKAKEK